MNLAILAAAALALPLHGGPQGGPRGDRAPVFDECADGSAEIGAALARARAENRRVLVVWGANWCVWCRNLHKLFRSHETIRLELLYEYEVVSIDVGRFDKHLDLMQTYGVDLSRSGIPFLTVLDAQGQVVANETTTGLEVDDPSRRVHDPQRVLELLVLHRALPLEAQGLLSAALSAAAAEDRRVLLHFGAPWCAHCHRFELWLRSPRVQPLLEKDLVLAKIDVDRTFGGEKLLERFDPGGKGGLPWYAILDASGNALATGLREDGTTLGHPRTPEEIERFAAMLTKACPRLSEEDVSDLKRSLAEAGQEDEKAKGKAGH